MSDVFRDRTEGAKARRLELLRRRRDELVTMPHVVRRVVVARSARIAASVAVCVVGAVLIVVASSPTLTDRIAGGLPGLMPAVLSTLLVATWAAGIVAYTLARSAAEHRFAVAMSRYVLPGDDLDHDLERLAHEHPDEIAMQMAHRLEVRSAALPIAAAAVLGPATALYVAAMVETGGWPTLNAFEVTLAAHASELAIIALVGFAASAVMTRRWARLPRMVPIAGYLAVMINLPLVVATATAAIAPVWLVGPAVISAAVAIVVWRLRIERARIEADDPAAGSELFTLRGALAQARRGLATLRARVRRSTVIAGAAVAGLVTVGGLAPIRIAGPARVGSIVSAELPIPSIDPSAPAPGSRYRIEQVRGPGTTYPTLRLTVVLVGDDAVDIPAIGGLDVIPHGWRGRLGVSLDAPFNTSSPFPVSVLMLRQGGLDPVPITFYSGSTHWLETAVCDDRTEPFGLRVQAGPGLPPGEHTLTFRIEPKLELASCLDADSAT